MKRRRRVDPPVLAPCHPLTGMVRVIREEEVAQARTTARQQFIGHLMTAEVTRPPWEQIDRWWPQERGLDARQPNV